MNHSSRLAQGLETLYRKYHRRAYVQPDPLELLYAYPDPRDREIAGLLAAGLAYGRVAQILASASNALERLGPAPRHWLDHTPPRHIARAFQGFKHRFTTGAEAAALLQAMRIVVRRHGALGACFHNHLAGGSADCWNAAAGFAVELEAAGAGCRNSLLPDPRKGSACKRLHLYLRWMVRCDEVDPGGWHNIDPRVLIVPLDTHMHAIARRLGFTRRRAAGRATALEISAAFRRFAPNDPVRYDFALTRLGIHPDGSMDELTPYLPPYTASGQSRACSPATPSPVP